MAKLARLLANEGAHEDGSADVRRIPRLRTRYYAFLSYSHQDKELADWLHRELEKFRVPHSLAGRLTATGVVPRRLTPIFRDEHDLSAADDLGEEIKAALAASQFLVVLCSPAAAKSRWTNAEIESFKRTRPEGCVLAAVASGEPFASDLPGRETEECFPPALRFKYDRRGHRTAKRAEPLAADLRGNAEQRRIGFLKLVAGMLGVGLDELIQRETMRRQRRLAWLAAGSIAGMAVTSSLAVAAIRARDAAREQRREAEGLVGFMLGDLRAKLEPIGRLDALDSVGIRALGYYQRQNKGSLSDEALAQRSKALSLIGEIATLRGDRDGALARYREAMAGTAEMVRRHPDNPQFLFDHAQNVFYVGEIARQRGQLQRAEQAFREYGRLADRMVGLEPGNTKWRMEVRYAEAEIGVVLYAQRRFAESSRQFEAARSTIEAISAADPRNLEYQTSIAEALAWLADSLRAEGRLDEAITQRERQVALLEQLAHKQPGDVSFREKLIPAYHGLGRLLASKGAVIEALEKLRDAVHIADPLLSSEPDNTKWSDYSADAHLTLGGLLLLARNSDEAATQIRLGCDLVSRLVARDSSVVPWRSLLHDCLARRAQLALTDHSNAEALSLAQQALEAARLARSEDPIGDRYQLADAHQLLGDIRSRAGDSVGSLREYSQGFATLPRGVTERPGETAIRSELLLRLGRRDEALPLTHKLAAIGYRQSI